MRAVRRRFSQATLQIGESSRDGQSPPSWGRCPAGQRGAPQSRNVGDTTSDLVATMPHSLLPPRHRANAKSMRKAMTDAELKLWNELRAHRLMGLGFRRQFPIAGYIVDFACPEKKLIVEVDGSQHSDAGFAEADEIRSKRLEQDGWTVLRFWNDDVIRTSTMSVSILLLRQDWLDQSETPAGQHPPLSCRTSPPQGGVWTGDIANRCARTSRTVCYPTVGLR